MTALRLALFLAALAPALWPAANSVTPTGKLVWPTRNDVATTTLEGRNFGETVVTAAFKAMSGKNYVATGLTVPAASTNLYLTVSAGTAHINGFFAKVTQNTLVHFPAANTYYGYLEIPTSGNLATDLQFTTNTTGTSPSTNAIRLFSAISNGTSMTAVTDLRPRGPGSRRSQTFTATGVFTVPDDLVYGFVGVELVGGGGGGSGADSDGSTCADLLGGQGGGGGSYLFEMVTVTAGQSFTVTIGAGGAPGANGTAGARTSGSAGGSTTFGALATAGGGGGGTVPSTGGTGGISTALNGYTIPGEKGQGGTNTCSFDGGTTYASPGGKGGNSHYGYGGLSFNPAAGGMLGASYGAGGAGGFGQTTTSFQPGTGTAGVAIIHY